MFRFLFLCCCFCTFGLNAQTGIPPTGAEVSVSGKVTDMDTEPIPFATVLFSSLETDKKFGGTTHDTDGSFSLYLLPGEYLISVSYLGYFTFTRKVKIKEETEFAPFVLKKKVETLDEVLITSEVRDNIEHHATGMIVNIENDSLFRKISAADVLEYLPGVRLGENGTISLNGIPATLMMDGKIRKISPDILRVLLEGIAGNTIKSIELINNPAAKYSGHIKKVIDINFKKQRDDGISGVVSSRIANADLTLAPSGGLNYKSGKFLFSFSALPYSYSTRKSTRNTDRKDLQEDLSFQETNINTDESFRKHYLFSTDYTINDKNSLLLNFDWQESRAEKKTDFSIEEFFNKNLVKRYRDDNFRISDNSSFQADLSYRFDPDKDTRLDIAASYGEIDEHEKEIYNGRIRDVTQNTEQVTTHRDKQTENNILISGRVDYSTLLGEQKDYPLEMGIKVDHVAIDNVNIFENYIPFETSYKTVPEFSSDFYYQETIYAGYGSLNSNEGRLKYSAGIRMEYIASASHSGKEGLTSEHSYFNLLPVISLKYMTGESQKSNVSLSYRKGYSLPPYIQVNPFETFVNSTSIRRGNPDLDQSVFHLINLGLNLQNKYFFSLSSNYYSDLIEVTELLENEINVISYQNIGNRALYSLDFNSSRRLWDWWRLYVSSSFYLTKVKGNKVDSHVSSFSLGLNHSFNLGKDLVIGINSDLNNGRSSSYDLPNDHLRLYSSAFISKKFLSQDLSLRFQVLDIFGVNNRDRKTYILGNTSYTTHTSIQRPLMTFSISYRFAAGKKVNKKSKKTSNVDGSRL